MTVHLNLQEDVMIQTRTLYLKDEVDFNDELGPDLEMLCGINKDPITIYISSNGGSVPDGIAIMRAIQKVQSEGVSVIGIVRGHALSMGFLILQQCTERRMGEFDILMAHGITSIMMGDMKDIEAQTKILNFWRTSFASFLDGRTNEDITYWESILKDNTPVYYTPDEALEAGLVDIVEG